MSNIEQLYRDKWTEYQNSFDPEESEKILLQFRGLEALLLNEVGIFKATEVRDSLPGFMEFFAFELKYKLLPKMIQRSEGYERMPRE